MKTASFRRNESLSTGEALLLQLEALCEKLQITIRRENVYLEEANASGGICRIKENYFIFIPPRATADEKIRIMTRALRQFDLRNLYLRPAIRVLLDANDEAK